MWERLRRFSALERSARGQFVCAAVLLPLISASLRLRGFLKTQALLQKFVSPTFVSPPEEHSSAPERTHADADLTVRMVRAAKRHTFICATCLEESLALWWLLARQGIGCHLRIGVRKDDERFEAHAWVERNGAALNEPKGNHLHYSAFDAALASLPPEAR